MNEQNTGADTVLGKVYNLEQALELRRKLKQEKRVLVFTNGCFDLIHPGHLRLLMKAKEMGDFLLVGMNSDSSIRRIKGKGRPIMPEDARLLLLCSLQMVDGVIVYDEEIPLGLIEALKPDCYVKGTGWLPHQLPEAQLVREYGGRIAVLESLAPFSTTKIIQKIRSLPADFL
ncbi:MAG TPA: adenylyltransferase/cytidyltransferase family protein [Clostridiales bacterium]|nr:adenylyltransferase/cytidyltransferase family protein [Clostridiales bacterium]